MTDDISVYDDVVSTNYQEAIKARLQQNNFPWFYVPNISRQTSGEGQLSMDTVEFAHSFYDNKKGQSASSPIF